MNTREEKMRCAATEQSHASKSNWLPLKPVNKYTWFVPMRSGIWFFIRTYLAICLSFLPLKRLHVSVRVPNMKNNMKRNPFSLSSYVISFLILCHRAFSGNLLWLTEPQPCDPLVKSFLIKKRKKNNNNSI